MSSTTTPAADPITVEMLLARIERLESALVQATTPTLGRITSPRRGVEIHQISVEYFRRLEEREGRPGTDRKMDYDLA